MPVDTPERAYISGLTMLSRRELSEAQVRERLIRRGFSRDAVNAAIDRLKREGSVDDRRTADAIARLETDGRRHGRFRVQRRIVAAGIAAATARQAVENAFADRDPDDLLQAALDKRLRGRTRLADDREAQRLYRYLIGQGFESDRVRTALDRLRRRHE